MYEITSQNANYLHLNFLSSGLALLDQQYVCTMQTTQETVTLDRGCLMSIVVTLLVTVS